MNRFAVALAVGLLVAQGRAEEAAPAAAPVNAETELRVELQAARDALTQAGRDLEQRRLEVQGSDADCARLTREIADLQAQINERQKKIEAALNADASFAALLRKRNDALKQFQDLQGRLAALRQTAQTESTDQK